jgi:hypothetical protein
MNEMRHLSSECSGHPFVAASRSTGRRIMVWDMKSDEPHGADSRIPAELTVTSPKEKATVVMVLGQREEQVGTYSVSGQPAYRQYVDLCVAYWPEKDVAGTSTIVSKEPIPIRRVRGEPQYGDPNKPISDWIKRNLT